jgi:hypothetical protein
MDKKNIVDNWDNYYKSYLELNQDIVLAGINTKRAALNHFIKYGYAEGRKIFKTDQMVLIPNPTPPSSFLNSVYELNEGEKIYLEEKMIIEKLDLNV